ncbi:MAG: DUF971 domain-containing protein [Phycisphaerae bacterium]
MTQPPTAINYYAQDRILEITWEAGTKARLSARHVRAACGCASCVDERTGARILDPQSIPEDIDIIAMHPVGNYALHIEWSDGHDTGIYPWERLRLLGPHEHGPAHGQEGCGCHHEPK